MPNNTTGARKSRPANHTARVPNHAYADFNLLPGDIINGEPTRRPRAGELILLYRKSDGQAADLCVHLATTTEPGLGRAFVTQNAAGARLAFPTAQFAACRVTFVTRPVNVRPKRGRAARPIDTRFADVVM